MDSHVPLDNRRHAAFRNEQLGVVFSSRKTLGLPLLCHDSSRRYPTSSPLPTRVSHGKFVLMIRTRMWSFVFSGSVTTKGARREGLRKFETLSVPTRGTSLQRVRPSAGEFRTPTNSVSYKAKNDKYMYVSLYKMCTRWLM